MKNKFFVWLVVFVLMLSGVYAVWVKKYDIYDYFALRGYNAPAEIAKLANEDKMTDKGRNIFYVNKPQISDRQAFSTECLKDNKPEQTIVLGCYNGVRIYIFDIEDPQLNGVEQVTAAHEMLHAAYDRLRPSERKRVDQLVVEQFKKLSNPRITALADSYNKQAPGSVPNELHSILATEVRDIGPELEAYYARYFSDRNAVVSYAISYEKKFEDLKNQVQAYDADLALRKAEIERLSTSLESEMQDLEAQKTRMDQLLANAQAREYNALVVNYNQKVADYNSTLERQKALIAEYNQIVEKRNQLAVEQQTLAKNLDSRLNPISN